MEVDHDVIFVDDTLHDMKEEGHGLSDKERK